MQIYTVNQTICNVTKNLLEIRMSRTSYVSATWVTGKSLLRLQQF